jgi:hypothetical protein
MLLTPAPALAIPSKREEVPFHACLRFEPKHRGLLKIFSYLILFLGKIGINNVRYIVKKLYIVHFATPLFLVLFVFKFKFFHKLTSAFTPSRAWHCRYWLAYRLQNDALPG